MTILLFQNETGKAITFTRYQHFDGERYSIIMKLLRPFFQITLMSAMHQGIIINSFWPILSLCLNKVKD